MLDKPFGVFLCAMMHYHGCTQDLEGGEFDITKKGLISECLQCTKTNGLDVYNISKQHSI